MAATAMAPILEARTQILYVENDEDSLQLLTFMLGSAGYEVATARTPAEALRLARLQGFDLFILESWLPDVSGVELCQQLRAFDAKTPILFYSTAAYDKDVAAGLAAGAQGYLVKPMGIYHIKEAVAELLTSKNEEGECRRGGDWLYNGGVGNLIKIAASRQIRYLQSKQDKSAIVL